MSPQRKRPCECGSFFTNHRRFCPAERPVSAPCVSASRCAVLSGETKQLAARGPGTVKKHRSRCDVSHQNQGFVVCACVRASARLCDIFFLSCRRPLRLCGGLDAACRLSTAVFFYFFFFSPSFPTFPPNFSSQRRSLWLAAFQAEIPLAWKHNPGNRQLRINLAQLWQRGGSRKWDIKSLAVGGKEGEGVRRHWSRIHYPLPNPPEGCQKKESSVAQDFPSDRDDWWLHKPPVDA